MDEDGSRNNNTNEDGPTGGTPERAKKTKKVPWHKVPLANTPQSKGEYVAACCNSLMEAPLCRASHSIERHKPGSMSAPSPLIASVRATCDAFPHLLNDARVVALSRTARSDQQGSTQRDHTGTLRDATESLPTKVLRSGPVRYIIPHPRVHIPCVICGTPLDTMCIEQAMYDPTQPSPWFVFCGPCRRGEVAHKEKSGDLINKP